MLRFLDISRSRSPLAWIGGVFGMGILLSAGLFLATRGWEQREQQERAAAITHEQIEKLHVSILRSMEVLHSVAALHRVGGRIERAPFQQFVQGALARQPELQAISWNPVVTAEQRAAFEAAAHADGLAQFAFCERSISGSLVPVHTRAQYVPVYLIEPLAGNLGALGFDLNSDESRRRSLEEARDAGQPVATAPIQLAQVPAEKAGFLVLLPVYRGNAPAPVSTVERRERIDGFAVAVFKVADLVGESFRELRSKGIIASLFDTSFDGELIYGTAITDPHSRTWLDVAGRRWAVAFAPTPAFAAGQGSWQAWVVLAGGLAFTLLSTAYLFGGWRRNEEIALANSALREEVKIRECAEAAAAAANQAKSDFLASMSHEIRTPLNAILGYAQLMQRDSQLSREQRDSIHGISTGGHHLLGLINEILDLSKIEAGRMELNPVHFDLDALGRSLTTTLKPLCAQKRIGFRFQIDPTTPRRVFGDEGKLRQVLINLLGNAVKFTNAGEVCLGCRTDVQGHWLFEVIDTGLGIPAEEQPDIFKPFHQGSGAQHQGGTGLGLAIAQRQVELLGGRLELQSERGIGSRFSFSIPLDQTAGSASEASLQVERLAPGQCVRALIVDDCAENRDVLGLMLANIGCDVSFAADGSEALRLARELPPQIVFLDLLLSGQRGTEIARQILAGHPLKPEGYSRTVLPACPEDQWAVNPHFVQPLDSSHKTVGESAVVREQAGSLSYLGGSHLGACAAGLVPPKIVMHSASALPEHREESIAAGCVEFLSKPIQCDKLYECLRTHLGVTFQYAEAENAPVDSALAELSRVMLPEALCARLAVAAELHSTTALKSALQELREIGPETQLLAEHLRQLMRSYDMDEIQRVLARVVVPISNPSSVVSSHGSSSSACSS